MKAKINMDLMAKFFYQVNYQNFISSKVGDPKADFKEERCINIK